MSHDDDDKPGSTSPPEGKPEEATKPPSNPEPDVDKIREAKEKLEEAGGGQ